MIQPSPLTITQTKAELLKYLNLPPSIYTLMAVCFAASNTPCPNALPHFSISDTLISTATIEGDSSSLQLADFGEDALER